MISFCLFNIVYYLRLNNNTCSNSHTQKPSHIHVVFLQLLLGYYSSTIFVR